jgi:hypothetical protein
MVPKVSPGVTFCRCRPSALFTYLYFVPSGKFLYNEYICEVCAGTRSGAVKEVKAVTDLTASRPSHEFCAPPVQTHACYPTHQGVSYTLTIASRCGYPTASAGTSGCNSLNDARRRAVPASRRAAVASARRSDASYARMTRPSRLFFLPGAPQAR